MAKKKVVKKVSKKKTTKKSPSKSTSKNTQNSSKKNGDLAIAIVGLVVNIIILPGLGSLIGGKTKDGIWQLVLVLLGIPLSLIIVGIPMIVAGWIWGIVTGIQMVREANE